MIGKILIANRGEIAVRIIRACAEMWVRSVAIYTEADRFSLHGKKPYESYSLGSDPLAGGRGIRRCDSKEDLQILNGRMLLQPSLTLTCMVNVIASR